MRSLAAEIGAEFQIETSNLGLSFRVSMPAASMAGCDWLELTAPAPRWLHASGAPRGRCALRGCANTASCFSTDKFLPWVRRAGAWLFVPALAVVAWGELTPHPPHLVNDLFGWDKAEHFTAYFGLCLLASLGWGLRALAGLGVAGRDGAGRGRWKSCRAWSAATATGMTNWPTAWARFWGWSWPSLIWPFRAGPASFRARNPRGPAMFSEFKKFAMRGNVIDLAVGVVIGAAFTGIVTSLVNDVIMPPIGWAMGGVDFSNFFVVLKGDRSVETLAAAKAAKDVTINYGLFVNTVINFLIVALALFMPDPPDQQAADPAAGIRADRCRRRRKTSCCCARSATP